MNRLKAWFIQQKEVRGAVEVKRENSVLQMLKILAIYLIGCLLWLLIFSIAMEPDETGATSQPFPGAICILGIATGTIVVLVVNYNSMQQAFQKTKAAFSNINVFKDRTIRLLDKANRVADKYMRHEHRVQTGVAAELAMPRRYIRTAEQFKIELENFPDLKANESVMELLAQIKDTENGFAKSKIDYNDAVERYNTLLHSFPNNLLRRLFKFQEAEFYNDEEEHEITDEELGI